MWGPRMTPGSGVRAVLFAKELGTLASFYARALDLALGASDEYHTVLRHGEFELVLQQMPAHIADDIHIAVPPVRREEGVIRLDFDVKQLEHSRTLARSMGGEIDTAPPGWAEPGTNFFLGFDPEGNVFGVRQQVR